MARRPALLLGCRLDLFQFILKSRRDDLPAEVKRTSRLDQQYGWWVKARRFAHETTGLLVVDCLQRRRVFKAFNGDLCYEGDNRKQ
jgi:hypothetical protein